MGIGYAPMKDPVTASDNKTYDRKNIIKFFDTTVNNKSPITGELLLNHDLEPNKKRKAQIDGYLKLKKEGKPVKEQIRYLRKLKY